MFTVAGYNTVANNCKHTLVQLVAQVMCTGSSGACVLLKTFSCVYLIRSVGWVADWYLEMQGALRWERYKTPGQGCEG
eukprot:jgi/Botrbrau1/22829/Bobra.0132s0152.1